MKTPRLTKDGKLPHITMPIKYGKMAGDIQDLFTERLPNHTMVEVCRYIAGYFYRQQKANEERIEALEAALDVIASNNGLALSWTSTAPMPMERYKDNCYEMMNIARAALGEKKDD